MIFEKQIWYQPILAEIPDGVTVNVREKPDGKKYYFLQNFNAHEADCPLKTDKVLIDTEKGKVYERSIRMSGYQVIIAEEK